MNELKKKLHEQFFDEREMQEFIPTLGNMIKDCDAILKDVPPYLRNDYAKLFSGTEIQKLLFSTKEFEEEASIYCEEAGWKRPS